MSTPVAFYRAFEERYRGSRELIKERVSVYLPFLEPLRTLYPNVTVTDLGCGRGEWLELLLAQGYQPQGVDLDEGMLAACVQAGLPAQKGEAIAFLQSLPDASQSVVSAFHMVEHIPFESLQTLVAEAHRVLRPGGLLILETPNAENINVGTHKFHLDPTHHKPLPPLLLSFLTEYHGFTRNKVLRLQEYQGLHTLPQLSLHNVFDGVSPDYSVVAQKPAEAQALKPFDAVFARSYGLTLEQLSDRYDAARHAWQQQQQQHLERLEQRLVHSEAQAGGLNTALGQIDSLHERLLASTGTEAHLRGLLEQQRMEAASQEAHGRQLLEQSQAEAAEHEARLRGLLEQSQVEAAETAAQLQQTASQLQESHRAAQQRLEENQTLQGTLRSLQQQLEDSQHQQQTLQQQLEDSRHQQRILQQQLQDSRQQEQALRHSGSWRITAPLRLCVDGLGHGSAAVVQAVAAAVRWLLLLIASPLLFVMRRILRHPDTSYRINQRILRYPRLHRLLRDLAVRHGFMPSAPAAAAPVTAESHPPLSQFPPSKPSAATMAQPPSSLHLEASAVERVKALIAS